MKSSAVAGPQGGAGSRLTGLTASLLFAITLSLYLLVPTAHYSFDAVAGGVLLNQWIALGRFAQLFHKYHILCLPLIALVEISPRGGAGRPAPGWGTHGYGVRTQS